MKIVATIGLDITKHIFQVHGAEKLGRSVLKRKLRRSEVARFLAEIPQCLESRKVEAHYLTRVLSGSGHTVRLVAPQFVKPCEVAEERRQRCGGDLRGGDPTPEAFRSAEVGRAAGPSVPSSCPQPTCRLPHAAHQPDPRAVGRVRDRAAATPWAGSPRIAGCSGGCREPTDGRGPGIVPEPLRGVGCSLESR